MSKSNRIPDGAHLITEIRGVRGFFGSHHGIYVRSKKVVHFTSCGTVEEVTLSSKEFYYNSCTIRHHKDNVLSSYEIVRNARSRIAKDKRYLYELFPRSKPYDLWEYNCEHFCEECITGKSCSSQVGQSCGYREDELLPPYSEWEKEYSEYYY